jgi:hypothetical protein
MQSGQEEHYFFQPAQVSGGTTLDLIPERNCWAAMAFVGARQPPALEPRL